MLEQDAVHIGCEADLAAHVLDVQGRQLSVKGTARHGSSSQCHASQNLDRHGFLRGRISYRQTSGWQLPIRERSMSPGEPRSSHCSSEGDIFG